MFEIEGPDDDGCVWICSPTDRDVWCQNLGPHEAVAEKWAGLAAIDFDG